MSKNTCGVDEARSHLSELLEKAHHGQAMLITKRGRPYAALVPINNMSRGKRKISICALRGTGAGLWGKNSAAAVGKMRDEWA